MIQSDSKTTNVYRFVSLVCCLPVTHKHLTKTPEMLAEGTYLTPLFYCYITLMLGAPLLSFVSVHFKRNLSSYVFFAAIALALYNALDIRLTALGLQETTAAIVTIGILCFFFHTVRLVLAWTVLATMITLAIALTVTDPQAPIFKFTIQLLACVAIPAMVSISMIRNKMALNKSNAVQEAIFAQSADALFSGNPLDLNSVKISQRGTELFETDYMEEIEPLISDAFHKAYGENGQAKITEAFTSRYWQGNLEFVTAKGNVFFGSIVVTKIDNTNTDTIVVRISDISEMRHKQHQLEEARDEAEAATEVRSRFLANMSHEIRTPMNGVIGMTSLLTDTNLTDEQNSYVETIRSSGESLLSIINEILDFSKIEASQIELERQVFDLEHCVADALDIVAPIASKKNLELILDLRPNDLALFEGDVQRLRQIIVNLLSNAIKFTESGEVILSVRAEQHQGSPNNNDCLIHFAIRDTGIGIAKSKIAALFDAFTQADQSTTRRFGGTGLGLSISKSLTQLMGGDIQVESQEGVGSTFSFWIKAARHATKESNDLQNLKGRTVFAVDHNKTNREIMSGLLNWLGMQVQMFETPQKLLAAMTNQVPDLIISDTPKPFMDDAHLANKKKIGLPSEPPIILLKYLDRNTQDRGAYATILRKPTRPSDLIYAISNVLNGTDNKLPRTLAKSLEPIDIGDCNILLAEDNLVNQTVAKKILKKLGVHVDIATNGLEAVEMISRKNYALIFMDVQMPTMDGLEATQIIRANQSIVQPQIVAMTANAMQEDKRKCLDTGMNDFVSKPIRIRDVHETLMRANLRGAFDIQEEKESIITEELA